jgi:hypothetical protein
VVARHYTNSREILFHRCQHFLQNQFCSHISNSINDYINHFLATQTKSVLIRVVAYPFPLHYQHVNIVPAHYSHHYFMYTVIRDAITRTTTDGISITPIVGADFVIVSHCFLWLGSCTAKKIGAQRKDIHTLRTFCLTVIG